MIRKSDVPPPPPPSREKPRPLAALGALTLLVIFFGSIIGPQLFWREWVSFLVDTFGDGAALAVIILLASGSFAALFTLTWRGMKRPFKLTLGAYALMVYIASNITGSGRGSGGMKRRDDIDIYVANQGGSNELSSVLIVAVLLVIFATLAGFIGAIVPKIGLITGSLTLLIIWTIIGFVFLV